VWRKFFGRASRGASTVRFQSLGDPLIEIVFLGIAATKVRIATRFILRQVLIGLLLISLSLSAAAKPGAGSASAAGASKQDASAKKNDEELLRWLRYITQLEAKLAKDPHDYNLMLRLADAYGRLGVEQREKVVSFTTRATLEGADDARVDIVLGDYYLRIKDLTSAIRAYLRVLDVAPEHSYTLVQLRSTVLLADPAKVDIDLKQIKKILADAGLYLPINVPSKPSPSAAKPLVEEGYGFIQQGDYDSALARFKSALDLDPYSAVAVRGMGISYAQTKKIREALAAYTAYLELDPTAEDADTVREVIDIFYETR
jgi:tetratricopeptide (TPR) repeat protein